MDPLSRPVLEFGSPEEKDSLRKQVLELWSPAAEETQRRRSSSHLAAVSSLSHLTMMLAGGESDVGGLPPNLHLSDTGKVFIDPLTRVLELGAIEHLLDSGAPNPFLDSIASSCFHMSGTACDVKAGTKEAVANLGPVHSETMCILPLTRCAEDAFTDALHVFSKRSEVLLEITNCAYQVTKVEHYYCLSLRPTVSPRRENSKCHQVPIFPDQNKGPTHQVPIFPDQNEGPT